jgi:hypothetical protein
MNATTELIDYVLRINPEHNALGPGFMANLITLAKRAQEQEQDKVPEEQDVPWIRHHPNDPVPQRYSRVKFFDGTESTYGHWSDRVWSYDGPGKAFYIEFYKP